MSQRRPSMQELLSAQFDYHMSDVYTAIPGVIVSVKDMGGMYVDVQPSIHMRMEGERESVPRPPISNVPLQLPVSTKGGVTFPVTAGDPVFLVFSMRGLDTWKTSDGTSATPSDLRKFDIRDCIAIPGAYPLGSSPNAVGKHSKPHSPDDVVLIHNIGGGAETEIRLKPNGNIEINSPQQVKVVCKDALVESENTTTIETKSMTINSDSFIVNTKTFGLSATDGAEMTTNMSMNGTLNHTGTLNVSGSAVVNGTPVEDHTHGGIQPGGGTTDPFGA